MTADELLMEARAVLPSRPSPAEAYAAQITGALLIDIRGDGQRRDGGLIPGALLLPRNALEWRCDPRGRWRHPAMTGRDQHLILICQEGFQSSLAAAALHRLGLVNATDLDGGFAAWALAGLPVTRAGIRDHRCVRCWLESAVRCGCPNLGECPLFGHRCGVQAEDHTGGWPGNEAARPHAELPRPSRRDAWTAAACSTLCCQGVGSGKDPL
jgi:rhodanese-related sulfurtransferase